MHEIEIGKGAIEEDPEKLCVLFREMIQMDLWYVKLLGLGTHFKTAGEMLPYVYLLSNI